MIGRLQEWGSLPALAIGGLLTRASAVSGGQFLLEGQGDFIGPSPLLRSGAAAWEPSAWKQRFVFSPRSAPRPIRYYALCL